MKGYDVATAAAELVERSTKAQGLGVEVTDPAALRRLAAILRSSPANESPPGERKRPLAEKAKDLIGTAAGAGMTERDKAIAEPLAATTTERAAS